MIMTDQEELAFLVLDNFTAGPNPGTAHINSEKAAEYILNAGYRKIPEARRITTKEEVNALPDRSVVITRLGDAVLIDRKKEPEPCFWHFLIADERFALTVLWEPRR
jgi:hypothetical protein